MSGSFRLSIAAAALVGLAAFSASLQPAWAQGGRVERLGPEGKLRQPSAHQVFQRDVNGRAVIPVELDGDWKDAKSVRAEIRSYSGDAGDVRANKDAASLPEFVEGKFSGVPTGGPYFVSVTVEKPGSRESVQVGPIFVGDLWVLAGQSNMQGVGDLIDVTPPHEKVSALGMDDKWVQAREPLHWLVDSPDPVHSGDPKTRAERSAQEHKTRTKGAGLGLPFAVEMVEKTGVPVGLIVTAHGGTSMAQWDPAKKGEGGKSLYGSMLRSINVAGGKVKGVLWYQGESDASPDSSKIYEDVFTKFIQAVRADIGQADLPFYYVQIGRVVRDGDPKGWNTVQDAQRRIVDKVANTAVVPVIDLELDDAIHVGTQGQKRVGKRLAQIALREQFGQAGASTPTFDRVTQGPNNTLEVKFRGVNRGLTGPAAMMGPGMMGGNPGMMNPQRWAEMNAAIRAQMTARYGSAATATQGLSPERHIAGFSIRDADGNAIPRIFEAAVGRSRESVILKLTAPVPPASSLWYGHGHDPYCNLVDAADMAVPVFGPIPLDPVITPAPAVAKADEKKEAKADPAPAKLLIITGDHGHDWKATTESLKKILSEGGKIAVDVTATPSKDLTDENLAKYDVLLLNYKDTPNGGPETKWSDANKEAFLKAVREGKGLVVYHFASSAFTNPNWEEYEKAIAGGWRTQGFHGPKHVFKVKKTDAKHPISEGLPAEFEHVIDELYQNSKLLSGTEVLATAWSDPAKPKGTDKDEPIIWVNTYGKGRVYNNALGHDVEALSDPNLQQWLRRGALWAATGKAE